MKCSATFWCYIQISDDAKKNNSKVCFNISKKKWNVMVFFSICTFCQVNTQVNTSTLEDEVFQGQNRINWIIPTISLSVPTRIVCTDKGYKKFQGKNIMKKYFRRKQRNTSRLPPDTGLTLAPRYRFPTVRPFEERQQYAPWTNIWDSKLTNTAAQYLTFDNEKNSAFNLVMKRFLLRGSGLNMIF